MADVSMEPPRGGSVVHPRSPKLPDLGEQLRLVAWLRWRSLRNGLRNRNRRMDLLGIVISGLFSSALVLGITAVLFVVTKYLFNEHKEKYLGLIFLALLLWWQLFPIMLAGFAPQFSFKSLLRFPLNLSTFYLIGLAYGLADAAAIAALIWMAAMIAGALASQPSAVPAMLLVCTLFATLNVTIERLLGEWLEKLLAKRRSRESLFGIFILCMISLQFLGPLLQKHGAETKVVVQGVLPYLWLLPSSFAGNLVMRASEGQWSACLLQLAGLLGYVLVFSALLWRRYAQLYAGEELSEGSAPAVEPNRAESENADDRDSLGFLPPQIVAVFRKEVRYLKRNTFLLFSVILSPAIAMIVVSQLGRTTVEGTRRAISPDMFFPGLMAYLVLILIAPSYNSFAHESRGIQTYFMWPIRFREILLGKNLMTVVIVIVELVLCILLVGFRAGFPTAPVLLATLTAMIFSLAGQLTIANWSSISFPKKMEFGRMQGQRNSGMSVFLMFGVQIVLGGISALILFSGRWTESPWLPVQLFAVLAAAAIGGYFASLDPLSRLAESKKEVLMEALCR